MDVGEYRHNYEGFCENFTCQTSIHMGTRTKSKSVRTNFLKNSLLSTLSLFLKSTKEEIQPFGHCVDKLEARHVKSFKNSFNKPYHH